MIVIHHGWIEPSWAKALCLRIIVAGEGAIGGESYCLCGFWVSLPALLDVGLL